MRIGCLQFAPQVGDTENNLNRADAVLSKANPDELDLLVLPELAFSGYNFKSLQDISPYLEPSGSGITSLWARTMALKYNCIVTVGYPERVDVSPKWPTGPEYYNSAIVVNEDGETIANYRKSFLYYTDESWALEGNRGFYEGTIPGLGNVSIGICMDLNPYKFEAPWNAFEFAFHILEVESNLVILSMAWMTREERRHFTRMPNEPDMETLTYWVTRLEPLIRSNHQDEIIVVFCNRTGTEGEATYAGTSAVIGIHDGEVKVYGLLGRGEKELLIVDTNRPPYAKLVHRPSGVGTEGQSGRLEASDKTNGSGSHEGKSTEDGGGKGDMPSDSKSREGEGRSYDGPTTSKGSHSVSTTGIQTTTPLSHSANAGQAVDGARSSQKKRPAEPIKVPTIADLSRTDQPSATPGSGTLSIPTPSAPSPTPMAVRPKLIIPSSPSIQPHQYPPDHPASAASLQSEKSTQSFKSDQSGASMQTIRSNPRPPEESTPYPHSGAPPSGYPQNFQAERRLLGRNVDVPHENGGLSPTTPSQDSLPSSPGGFFWRPDVALRTPISAGGWTPGTAIGRRPEPFPWPDIKRLSQKESLPGTEGRSATAPDLRGECHLPQSDSSFHRTTQSARAASATGRTDYSGTKEDHHPARPPSPKSRNASRSRMGDESHSVLGEKGANDAVWAHLEGISQRAESANSMRHPNQTPVIDRPESPKSRNCSRSRPSDDDPFSIPIAASPSVFQPVTSTPEARSFYRPMSRADVSTVDSPSLAGSNIPRVASRTASRGRQPGPQAPLPLQTDRATSRDSTRNGRLHTRVSRRDSRGQTSSNTSQNRRSSSGQQQDLSQFERIESFICPDCPVHGERSSSAADGTADGSPQPSNPNPDGIPSQNGASEHHNISMSSPGRIQTADSAKPTRSSTQSRQQDPQYVSGDISEASDSNSLDTHQSFSVGTTSTASSIFDPPTPKAMMFNSDDVVLATTEPAGLGGFKRHSLGHLDTATTMA